MCHSIRVRLRHRDRQLYIHTASCQQTVGLTRATKLEPRAHPFPRLSACCILSRAPASLLPLEFLSRFHLSSRKAACL